MRYISTRASESEVSASQAIVNGISNDGGLFVPSSFPKIELDELLAMQDLNYAERSAKVLHKFMDEFTYEELLDYTTKAYSRFYGEDPCPLVVIDDTTAILELWHGPTCAFKDMALTLLPHLMTASRRKTGETNKTLILVATSGDTGKAALEGFKDVENCEIMVFYPSEGVSEMQKLQMMTQAGDNVYVCAIEGNFDDAQSAVKTIFADNQVKEELLKKGYKLSSANSINWGRLVPQVAYYVSSYVDLISTGEIKVGEEINFCVPSGNFGNILAGYYAMRMGVPINKLICASNVNNVLTDFINSGDYDINRDFYKTMSPSMDILISSNLERLLFEIGGRDASFVSNLMQELKTNGRYTISKKDLAKNASMFVGDYSDEDETTECMYAFYDQNDYLLDPHTAVATCVYNKYLISTNDETLTVIVSTASPFKFPSDVYYALSDTYIEDNILAAKKLSSYTGDEIPQPLEDLNKKQIRFKKVIAKENIKNEVLSYIQNK